MTRLPWSSPRAVRSQGCGELVEVDYEPLPSVGNVTKALEDGAPLVHPDFGTNECYVWKLETDDVQAAIDAADVVVTRRYFQPRLIPNAIEPRGVLAQVAPTGDVTLWSATQTPHIQRFALQLVLGIPESKIRVIAPDVGGGFGSKIQAARVRSHRTGSAPGARGDEERAENYVGTIHGRDVVHELTLAARGTASSPRSSGGVCAMCILSCHARDPLLGGSTGPYEIPNYSVAGRLHAHDADRCLCGAGGRRSDVCPRAHDGRVARESD